MPAELLNSVLKEINKKFGDAIIASGVHKESREKFSLGSPSADFMTYNSIPEGAWIEVTGQEGSGKSLLAFLMAADFSRKEAKKPEEERRHVLFVDCEGTLDPEWCWTSSHYDVNNQDVKTYYVTPLGQSAEQIFDMIRKMVLTGGIGLVILDSLTAMAPQQVIDESFEKKEMGGISKPLADFVKRCTGLFNKYRTTFIGINGSIANMTGYGQAEVTGGGTYFKRACSLRIKTKKTTYFDDDWNELKSTAENPAGHIIELGLLKSKFCRGDRRLSFIHLNYRKGVDILWDTIELAINIGLIDNSTQGTFRLVDLETGEVMTDSEGNEIKIRGKKNLKPYFESHPEDWKKLYDKVYEKISIKDDVTIKSFEELLGINNLDEYLGITEEDKD